MAAVSVKRSIVVIICPSPPPLPRCKLTEKVDNRYTFTSVSK